jgi:hypothetical protein
VGSRQAVRGHAAGGRLGLPAGWTRLLPLAAAAELRGNHEPALADVDREAALEVIRPYQQETRKLLAGLARAAGAADPELLAADLHLEIVGILTISTVDLSPSRAAARRVAQRAAERTLAFHGIGG